MQGPFFMSYEFQSTLVDVTANYRIAGNQIGGVRIEMAGNIKVARVIRTTDADVSFALSGPYEAGDPDAIYAALSADLYEIATGVLINEGAIGSVDHDASQIILDLKGSDRAFVFKRSEDAGQVDPIETADRRWTLPQASFDALKAAAAVWRSSVDGELESLSSAITAEAAARVAADAVLQADIDLNESDADAAIAAEAATREANDNTIIASVDGEASTREAADTALSGRLDVLEADPTTAAAVAAGDAASVASANSYTDTAITNLTGSAPLVLDTLGEIAQAINDDANVYTTLVGQIAAVQSDVDGNESDGDAADAALSGRLDALELDPVTKAYVDAADGSEATTRGNADTALSGRLDTLEADPVTKTYVDTADALKLDASSVSAYGATLIDDADAASARTTLGLGSAATTASGDYATAAQGALADSAVQPAAISNVDNTSDADKPVSTAQQAALDLKAPLADPDFTGQLDVDVNLRLEFDSNLTKIHNILRGSSIEIGNNIQMKPAAAGGRVEIAGQLQLDITEVPEYSNDSQAAAGGIVVGGFYRSNSVLHIRVS